MDADYDGREVAKQMGQPMQRQCAWCLRLMNENGEPIPSHALSKIYEATHGMCYECGERWVEDMISHGTCSGNEKMSARELVAHFSLNATISTSLTTS